jgi:hypothetical protein
MHPSYPRRGRSAGAASGVTLMEARHSEMLFRESMDRTQALSWKMSRSPRNASQLLRREASR